MEAGTSSFKVEHTSHKIKGVNNVEVSKITVMTHEDLKTRFYNNNQTSTPNQLGILQDELIYEKFIQPYYANHGNR